MCGLTGYLAVAPEAEAAMVARVTEMAAAITYRGPDSGGAWADPEAGIALGHRRLAIVDLSEAGAQPMTAPSGRFVMVYNGEIYNHADLRAELDAAGKAPTWRGHSDTETLLAGIDAWGLTGTLTRAIGMFAIALWDREARVLKLARDRMGEKPLYYGWQGDAFLFGSEMKALAAHPAFRRDVNRDMLPEFLRHGHVGENRSIYRGIAKVRPGQIVTIPGKNTDVLTETYWSGAEIAAHRGGPDAPRFESPEAAVTALETLLLDAVGRQMMSDVPLGAFLSGGIDSSTVVALMQKLSDRPVHTFSIGFHEERYNEAEHARAVAAHLGTHHTDLYVDEATLLGVVPKLATMYDEPHADSSQIPTYLVSKLAREHVTVALSGDGGDEIFCGYGRYKQGADLMAGLGRLPLPVRRVLAGTIRSVPMGVLDRVVSLARSVPQGKEQNGQWVRRLADYLASPDTETLHKKLVSRWRFPEAAVPGAVVPPTMLDAHAPLRGDLGDMERMMQLDMLTYMPDDILAKVDRATMAVSLESRAPLLDHRVAELAWSLPMDWKHRDGLSKWALRQVLYKYVPSELIDRPKMGFEVPIGIWLKGPLRDWAGDLLSPERIRKDGILDADVITQLWEQHQKGQANWGAQLWPVVIFQDWMANGLGHRRAR